MGEVGESAVADLAMEAEGFAEEDGGRGVAVGDGGDIHAYMISHSEQYSRCKTFIYMPTYIETN
jgi:hypothetical protein